MKDYAISACPKPPHCFLCGINGTGKAWYDKKRKDDPLYTPICPCCEESSQDKIIIKEVE